MMQTFDYFCARLDQRLTKHYQSSLGNLVRSQNVSTNKSFRRLFKERKKERKKEREKNLFDPSIAFTVNFYYIYYSSIDFTTVNQNVIFSFTVCQLQQKRFMPSAFKQLIKQEIRIGSQVFSIHFCQSIVVNCIIC